LSVFNNSFLTVGNEADRDWLVSVRKGNLDLVIDPEFGSPSYFDVFGEYSFDISPNATLSLNALFAKDNIEVVLESEPAELERVVSSTSNAQFWVQLDNRWSSDLSSKIVLSSVSFDNTRYGSLGDAEKLVASVSDERKVEQFSFRQDWVWNSSQKHLIQWGVGVTYLKAKYDYANSAEYFGLQAMYEDQPESSSFAAMAEPRGSSYSFYYSDRWKTSPKSVLEWGLRWDDQTYTDLSSDSQLSPRLNFMRSLGPKTGWYYQFLAGAACGSYDCRDSSLVSRFLFVTCRGIQ
jgi:hypothetical protein